MDWRIFLMPKNFDFGDKMPKKPIDELPDDAVFVLNDKQDFADFDAAFATVNKGKGEKK